MVITNNGTTNRVYETDIHGLMKMKNTCIFPVGASTWSIDQIMPLALFSKAFIDDIAAVTLSITYTADIPFLDNIQAFLNTNPNRVLPIRYSIL